MNERRITMSEKTKQWLKAAGVRAVKTVAQTAVATIGTSAVLSAVDWKVVVSASILAGILSILTSLAGLPEVNEEEAAEQKEVV
jgi:hypothetical protein